jgi:radical SAM-linked protein
MFVHHTNLEEHTEDKRKLVCYHCGVACDLQQMRDERGDFLIKLGALRPKTAVLPPAAADSSTEAEPEPAPKPKPKPARKAPPVRPDQGASVRVRVGYRKLGRAAFGSHLDMVRQLPRLFRRLDIPVYYSLGFHSKPVMMFGPALSLGVSSLHEYVDLKLCARDELHWQDLPARLNEATIDGLSFFGASLLTPGDRKLSQVIHEAVYVAGLPRAALTAAGCKSTDELRELVQARRQGELRTRRIIEGIGKWVDVQQYLADVEVGAGAETLAEAGVAGDLTPVRVRMRITDSGTAKISEALETLLGCTELPARFVRERLLWRFGAVSGEPLEVERLRDVQAPASASMLSDRATDVSSPTPDP